MITPDGDRSKKRLWFAKKQLAVIKDIDVPAKAVKWDGFTFKVWQQGDLEGGRVTAPMGAVVLCSTQAGIKMSVADYWAGGFTTYSDLHVLFYKVADDEISIVLADRLTVEDFELASQETVLIDGAMVTKDYQTIKFRPMVTQDPFGLTDGTSVGPATVYMDDYSCQPGVMPYKGGEAFRISVSDYMFIDLNGNGIADDPKTICDHSAVYYSANGSNLGGRITAALETGWGLISAPWRISYQLAEDWTVMFQNVDYDSGDGDKLIARNFQGLTYWPLTMPEMIPEGAMDEDLREIFLNGTERLAIMPIGSYSFAVNGVQTFLHAFNATITGTDASQYMYDNPSQEKWKLFYSMRIGAASYVVDSSQFINLLDTLATVTIIDTSTDWENARRMMQQLFAHPNNLFTVPYDSCMFHGHDGNVYTWTREYGSVYFSPSGLFVAAVNVPAEVMVEEGVRPDISYSGTFDTIPLYLCICNKVTEEVKAVYYGSPFASWHELPGIDDGITLVHVRPVRVTPDNIFLIGVVKETIEEVEYYSFASLQWVVDAEGLASTTLWRKMGRLPFPVGEADCFSVGLFGEDGRVNDLATYASPPPIVPQQPVGPYAKYAIGMP